MSLINKSKFEEKLACYEFFIWHSYNDTYVSLFQEAFGVEPSKEWGKDKDGNPVPMAEKIKEIRNNFSPIYGTFTTKKEDPKDNEMLRKREGKYGLSNYAGQLYYIKKYTDEIFIHGIISKTEDTKFKIFDSEKDMFKDRDEDLSSGAGKVTIPLPRKFEPKSFKARDGRDFIKLTVPENNGHEFEDSNRRTFVLPKDKDHYDADENTITVKTYHSTTLESSDDPGNPDKVSNITLSEMFADYYKDKYLKIWNIQPTIEPSADEAEYDDEEGER